jgi:hypothetical protein
MSPIAENLPGSAEDTPAPKASRKAWAQALFGGAVGLFLTAVWFWSSTIHYARGETLLPQGTSIHFLFGLIIIIPAAAVYGAVFVAAVHMCGRHAALILLLCVSGVLIALAVRSSLPRNRIRWLIGDRAADLATVERLRTLKTLNDGTYYAGVLKGPPELIEIIQAHPSLEPGPEGFSSWFQDMFPDIALPRTGTVLTNKGLAFLLDPDGNSVFFSFVPPYRVPTPNRANEPTLPDP